MTPSMVPTVLVSFFLVCMIIGFLIGWIRGFSRSLTRFLMVMGVAVLAFFVVPAITKAILEVDISKYNIFVGEGEDRVQILTVGEYIPEFLKTLPVLKDPIQASPTLAAIITLVPQMLCNVVLFILFFFLFKWVSMIIYWIIWGVFFSKKKMKDKDKHKFVGAVIGLFQGLLVAIVIMVPVFGLVETTRPVVFAMKEEEEEQTETRTIVDQNLGVYYVTVSSSESTSADEPNEDSKTSSNENELMPQEYVDAVAKYYEAFDKSWFIKVFDKIKIKALTVKMFDKLTTVSQNDLTVSLRGEVNSIAGAYKELEPFLSANNINFEDKETFDKLHAAIEKIYESPVVSGIISEIIPKVADRWTNTEEGVEKTFMGLAKPDLGDERFNTLFDALLNNLKISEKDDIKTDLLTVIDVAGDAADAGLITAVKNNTALEFLTGDGNEGLLGTLIEKALESNSLKAVLPDVVSIAMTMVYDTLKVPANDRPAITRPETIDWEDEKECLSGIFKNVIKLYKGYTSAEGSDPLQKIDFEVLGLMFDDIRASALFGPNSYPLLSTLMKSDMLAGSNMEFAEKFIADLEEPWKDTTKSLAPTFKALQEALLLARDLQNGISDLSVEKVGDIIKTLAKDETLRDTVSGIISDEETLVKLGLTSDVAGIVSETVTAVFDNFSKMQDEENPEVFETKFGAEVDAVVSVLEIATKAFGEETTEITISSTEANKLIGNIAKSDYVKAQITDAASAATNLGLDTKLTTESKKAISDALALDENAKLLSVKDNNALKALFGIE